MSNNSKGLADTFGLIATQGGVLGTAKDLAMLAVGAELAILGLKHLLLNLAIVLVLESYQGSVYLVNDALKKMLEVENQQLREFAQYILGSKLRVFFLLFILAFLLSVVLVVLVRFFLKLAIGIASVIIFTKGFGAYFLIQLGVTNELVRMVIGVVFGVALVMLFESKIRNVLFSALFAFSGVCLIFIALNELLSLKLAIPQMAFSDPNSLTAASQHLKESAMYCISVALSMIVQIMLVRE